MALEHNFQMKLLTPSWKLFRLKQLISCVKNLAFSLLLGLLCSVNIGHLEAVLYILQQPFINGVSRVCKPVPQAPAIKGVERIESVSKSTHVDIVCSVKGNPIWIIVSDRNPKYVSWKGCTRTKGLRSRMEQVLAAARSSVALRPSLIILFFSKGVDGRVLEEIEHHFGASKFKLVNPDFDFTEEQDGEWINIVTRSYRESVTLEIKVDHLDRPDPVSDYGLRSSVLGSEATEVSEEKSSLEPHVAFNALVSTMRPPVEVNEMEIAKPGDFLGGENLINLDTTALIALVSEISNGGAEKILSKSENELRLRFKGNMDFVIGQVIFII